MATVMTFDTLKQDVQRYLERGATLASDAVVYEQIPRLINLAERRIARLFPSALIGEGLLASPGLRSSHGQILPRGRPAGA